MSKRIGEFRQPTTVETINELVQTLDRARAAASSLRARGGAGIAPGTEFERLHRDQRELYESTPSVLSGAPMSNLRIIMERLSRSESAATSYLMLVHLSALAELIADRRFGSGARHATDVIRRATEELRQP